MFVISWNDSLSVGISEIDEQHKQWVALYNDMDDKLLEGENETEECEIKETLADKHIIGEDKKYSQFHATGSK